jgi:hypothetical protein
MLTGVLTLAASALQAGDSHTATPSLRIIEKNRTPVRALYFSAESEKKLPDRHLTGPPLHLICQKGPTLWISPVSGHVWLPTFSEILRNIG